MTPAPETAPPVPFDAIGASSTDDDIAAAIGDRPVDQLVGDGVAWLVARFDGAATNGIDGVIQWEVTGGRRHRWQLIVDAGACTAVEVADADDPPRRAHVVVAASPVEFVRIVSGASELIDSFTAGRVVIGGNLPLARAFSAWFPVGP